MIKLIKVKNLSKKNFIPQASKLRNEALVLKKMHGKIKMRKCLENNSPAST